MDCAGPVSRNAVFRPQWPTSTCGVEPVNSGRCLKSTCRTRRAVPETILECYDHVGGLTDATTRLCSTAFCCAVVDPTDSGSEGIEFIGSRWAASVHDKRSL